jgi:hypothetical protein
LDGESRTHDPAAAISAVVTGFVEVVLVLQPAFSACANRLPGALPGLVSGVLSACACG